MGKRDAYRRDLEILLTQSLEDGASEEMLHFLTAHSNLPGRRANLELAHAFADLVEENAHRRAERLWDFCSSMTELSAAQAPTNEPDEFLPFCGAIGLGAIGAQDDSLFVPALQSLGKLAHDARWRMREAVRFGLQRLLISRSEDVLLVLEEWVAGGSNLQMRAAATAVARPDLLQRREFAFSALRLHSQIVAQALEMTDRRAEDFRTLRKALGYTLSVVTQAIPNEGFRLLEQLAVSGDRDMIWIARQNLQKKRLSEHFGDQVEAIRSVMSGEGAVR
jgi:hypothetical protein